MSDTCPNCEKIANSLEALLKKLRQQPKPKKSKPPKKIVDTVGDTCRHGKLWTAYCDYC